MLDTMTLDLKECMFEAIIEESNVPLVAIKICSEDQITTMYLACVVNNY